jgi:hypothetical protein
MQESRASILPVFLVLTVGLLVLLPVALPIRANKMMMAQWMVFLFVSWTYIENKWLRGFLIWSVILTAMRYNQYSHFNLVIMVMYSLYYQMIKNRYSDKIQKILDIVCIIVIINFCMMALQYLGVYFYIKPLPKFESLNHVFGFFGSRMTCGIFMALGMVAFFRGKLKYFIPVIFLAISVTGSLTAILMAVISCSIYFWKSKYRKIVIPIILSALIIYAFAFEPSYKNIMDGSNRVGAWKDMVEIGLLFKGKEGNYNPNLVLLTGWGVGQFKIMFTTVQDGVDFLSRTTPGERWIFAHNDYLQLWIEQGLIGLFFAIMFLYGEIRKGLKQKSDAQIIVFAGVCSIIIGSFASFFNHTALGLLVVTYFALLNPKKEGVLCLKGFA